MVSGSLLLSRAAPFMLQPNNPRRGTLMPFTGGIETFFYLHQTSYAPVEVAVTRLGQDQPHVVLFVSTTPHASMDNHFWTDTTQADDCAEIELTNDHPKYCTDCFYYVTVLYLNPETETDPFYQTPGGYGGRYAYLRTAVEDGIVTGETAGTIMAYMEAVEAAKAITTDINARYEAFANAEALLIENALAIPMGMSVPAYLATRLNYWEGQYASTGFSNKRLKGIHVLDHYVSMSEYEANRDAR